MAPHLSPSAPARPLSLRAAALVLPALLLFPAPSHADTWLQRYLRNHRPKATQQTTEQAAEPAEPEVRRALPVDPADSIESIPASTPDSVPAIDNLPVRRAEPVNPGDFNTFPAELPIRRAEPVEPIATPSATPIAPAATPVAPAATPSPTPVPEAPVLRAQPVTPPEAQPSPTATPALPLEPQPPPSAATEQAPDPNQEVIRLTPGAAPQPPDRVQFQIANDLYARKEYTQAAPEFERYLSLFPTAADRNVALYRLAESYRQIGNANSARKTYETLAVSRDNNEWVGAAAYRLADLCFAEKDTTNALTFYQKAAIQLKDPALLLAARFNIARCYELLQFPEDAIRNYDEVLAVKESNPYRETAALAAAQLAITRGHKTEAIQRLTTLRNETDKDAIRGETSVRIGLLLLEQGQNAQATAAFQQALTYGKQGDLGEWREVAELGVLRVLYNEAKYQDLLETYRTSSKEFSAQALPEVLLIVANAHRQLSHFTDARALYEQAIRDFPGTVYAREAEYERIMALYNMDAPELLQEIDAYLARNPEANAKRDQLTLVKAESLYKTKQFAAAAPIYAALNASKLSPSLRAEAAFKQGWCLAQTRDYPAAIRAFSNFLAKNATHRLAPTALAQRALCQQKSNHLAEAVRDFDALLKQFPKAKERELALQQKALILGQQEENAGMVAAFKQLLKEFPKSTAAGQANYWIGSTAMQAKNYKAAVEPLQNARTLDADFTERATTLLLWAHYSLEDRDAAAAEVDRLLGDPRNPVKVPSEILRWLGINYFTAGDAAHAEHYLTLLTARAKEEEIPADDWLNLGRARIQMSRWADAATALQTYLGSVSDPAPLATGHLALGQAQLGAGQTSEAQQSANEAMKLQPEGRLNLQARLLQGDIAMARAEYETAAKAYQSAVILGIEDPALTPKALEKACLAYKKAGNAKQAAKVLNELQSRYPEYPVPAL